VVLFEGGFKRNYVHVRDVSRVFQHSLENFAKMKGEIYNIGLSDANISKEELCQRIKNYLPKFIFMNAEVGKDPDQRNYIVSNEKIAKSGFITKYSLEDGIEELVKGFSMLKNTKYGNL
jgi:nucleoside-diphosphate-sugar epimerase